jgi:serine/threonine-protein phosphatase PGAM5
MRLPYLRLSFALLVAALASPGVLAQSEPGTRTLFLVRHGIYDAKADADDRTGNALNPLGHEQAALTAARLAGLPLKFDSVTSSEFTRARETGDIIAAKLGLTCARDPMLNEASPSRVGQQTKAEQAAADTQLAHAWARYSVPVHGPAVHQILVCHGNVIRWFVCRALGVDTQHWLSMEIANCSLTVIQIREDGSIKLQMFNDVSHVPLEKQTWAGKGPGWPLPAQPQATQRTK